MNNFKPTFGETIVVKNVEELATFADAFLKKITSVSAASNVASESAVVVGLSGDLGAGKTTFSKYIAELLGVKEVVTSPTFGIQKQYKTNTGATDSSTSPSISSTPASQSFEEFIHIDAYRIEDIKEVGTLRFVELFQKPKTLIFIEWPEKIAEVLPKETIMLSFEAIDENTRKISY